MDLPPPFDAFVEAVAAAGRASAAALPAAADLLAGCPGTVVATGAGKSGIAARKLAATLATGGRRALALDPGAARHGESAALGPDDRLVAVSRSGETGEVVDLALAAPCPVVAVTARPESRLGRAAVVVLPCGTVADPSLPLPTATFLAACAVLDALALAVLAASPDVLAGHPAGALGRGRDLTVARVMHPPPLVGPDLPVPDLLAVLTRHALGAVLVEDGGLLAGIVTDGDLRRGVERLGAGVLQARARDLATPRPVTVGPAASLTEAVRLMEDRPSQIAVLPVVDDQGRPVGLLRLHDVVRVGAG